MLDEIDKKAMLSPAVASPRSPATPEAPASPAPYAGKFDPKAIAKKAASGLAGVTKLGAIALPEPVKASATLNSIRVTLKADKTAATELLSSTYYSSQKTVSACSHSKAAAAPTIPLKAHGNVSGFGLASKLAAEPEKPSTKRALNFGDEEGSRKKLEKLPAPLPISTTNGDAAMVNSFKDDPNDEDEDEGMPDVDATEEESAAAARLLREERVQAHNLAHQSAEENEQLGVKESETNGDIPMTEFATDVKAEESANAEEEESDPLDAFMNGIGDLEIPKTINRLKITKQKLQQPEAMFGDEDVDLQTREADEDILAMTSKRKKKDLPVTNHAKINYEPFRKAFYQVPQEVKDMTEEALAALRLELDDIKVQGAAPPVAQTWGQCGLSVQVLQVIQKLGYDKPSPIQAQAIPVISSGHDLLGVAKTGSGKTIAFLLPLFRHILDARPPTSTNQGPSAIVLAPTRELCVQIYKECKPFLKALNLRAVCAYGGAPIKDQIADLKRGAEIIVCTPGRMIDLLAANSGRVTNLRRVTFVVLDEADRILDLGFKPQITKILTNIRPDKQIVAFSATAPRQADTLTREILSNPIQIVVGGKAVIPQTIKQLVEVRAEGAKFIRLLELLGNLYENDTEELSLIFVEKQESADELLKKLMQKGYPCMSIHGGKDQIDRDSTIDDFKAGIVPILIATSVAARGLDVPKLTLVINYDVPSHAEDYIHRIGRTGRAGREGTAVTFITEEQDRYSRDIAKVLKQSGQTVPGELQKLVDGFDDKVKSGEEKVYGSGFGGKGLERLDQDRDAARNRERKTYKTGEEGDDEAEDEKKDKGDDLVLKAASNVQPASVPTPLLGVPKGIDLDGKITVHKTDNPLEKVNLAIASINNRLSNTRTLRQGVPIDNKGPDAGAFHATLEINDFPQKARWGVTNRTNVAKILEATGTSITTKGSFYQAGKEPPTGGDPKLYILVEGDTEVVVTNAMRELMRLLKEGTIAAADSDARAPASGRYNVI